MFFSDFQSFFLENSLVPNRNSWKKRSPFHWKRLHVIFFNQLHYQTLFKPGFVFCSMLSSLLIGLIVFKGLSGLSSGIRFVFPTNCLSLQGLCSLLTSSCFSNLRFWGSFELKMLSCHWIFRRGFEPVEWAAWSKCPKRSTKAKHGYLWLQETGIDPSNFFQSYVQKLWITV